MWFWWTLNINLHIVIARLSSLVLQANLDPSALHMVLYGPYSFFFPIFLPCTIFLLCSTLHLSLPSLLPLVPACVLPLGTPHTYLLFSYVTRILLPLSSYCIYFPHLPSLSRFLPHISANTLPIRTIFRGFGRLTSPYIIITRQKVRKGFLQWDMDLAESPFLQLVSFIKYFHIPLYDKWMLS